MSSQSPSGPAGDLLYLCTEKIRSVLHSASEIMRWGSLIDFEFHEILKILGKQTKTAPVPAERSGLSAEYAERLLLRLRLRVSLATGHWRHRHQNESWLTQGHWGSVADSDETRFLIAIGTIH